MTRLLHRLRHFVRDEQGTATAEFALMVPLFFSLFLIGVDAGQLKIRQVMLDRALDIAIRDLRLGTLQQPTLAQLRSRVCANTAIFANCETDLLIELRPVNTATWVLPADPPACIDRSATINPVTTITGGGSNEMMIVRACMIVDPIFPTTPWALQLPLDANGGFQMFSLSSFVNEPR